MNGKQQAIDKINNFLKSNEKGMLVTGTHQYEKHYLVMKLLNKYYKNAHVLFRINALQNITGDSFTPLKKKPKAGERVKIGNNYYTFDAFLSKTTWNKTCGKFDFAIVYPIDYICRSGEIEPIEELYRFRNINKTFLCSWTDSKENDYTLLSKYYESHVTYDSQEDDPAYHNRVLKVMEGEYYG